MEDLNDDNLQINPYHGIFYNLSGSEDTTNIQFVSVLFFYLFMCKMQADFQLTRSTDVHVYRINARRQRNKCHIVLNSTTRSVHISESGQKAWTEEFIIKTTPILLSLAGRTHKSRTWCISRTRVLWN